MLFFSQKHDFDHLAVNLKQTPNRSNVRFLTVNYNQYTLKQHNTTYLKAYYVH